MREKLTGFYRFYVACILILFFQNAMSAQSILAGDSAAGPVGDRIFIAQTGELDADADGLADSLEQQLAEKFAPIIYHAADEPNLPSNVEKYFSKANIGFFDADCRPESVALGPLKIEELLYLKRSGCAEPGNIITSYGFRSDKKKNTFYLGLNGPDERRGSTDSREWVTYFHSYSNDVGGITIQYWRFCHYNTGYFLGLKASVGNHEGDWESVQVVLDSRAEPLSVRLLGHRDIAEKPWSELLTDGTHPEIKSDKGGHSSRLFSTGDKRRADRFIRQETNTGGKVLWPADSKSGSPGNSTTGPLTNLGEKTQPMPGMQFIRYSGLWGNRVTGLFSSFNSGYWGPAFNETAMRKDGFITAWCYGMKMPQKEISIKDAAPTRECFPSARGK